jgi:mono/diheme cytochrome c family protein
MRRLAAVGALLVLAVGALAWSAPGSAAAPPAQEGDAARGRELYVRIGCYQCHGFDGQGAAATGPRLAPNPIAFNRFMGIVYDPIDLMPRYPREYVSEDDVRDIYAYLQSIPRPPDVADIPLLNP